MNYFLINEPKLINFFSEWRLKVAQIPRLNLLRRQIQVLIKHDILMDDCYATAMLCNPLLQSEIIPLHATNSQLIVVHGADVLFSLRLGSDREFNKYLKK